MQRKIPEAPSIAVQWIKQKKGKAYMPSHIAQSIIKYMHTTLDKKNNKLTLKNLLLGGLSIPVGNNASNYYRAICKQAGVTPRNFRRKAKLRVSSIKPKYLNPLIQQHLDIAAQLIKEEGVKIAIYNEMKQLIKG